MKLGTAMGQGTEAAICAVGRFDADELARLVEAAGIGKTILGSDLS